MVLVFLVMLSINNSIDAQCQLNSEDLVHVFLDNSTCDALLTKEMFLSDDGAGCVIADHFEFEVRTFDGSTVIIPMTETAILDYTNIGGPYMVIFEAHDAAHNLISTGMSTFDVADKMPPVINCPTAPLEVACWQDDATLLTAVENCTDYSLVWTDQVVISNDCSTGPNGLNWPVLRFKQIERTYVAVDGSGNQSLPCSVTVNVNAFDSGTSPYLAYIWGVRNFENVAGTAIDCHEADNYKNANGDFDPDKTGWPQLIHFDENPTMEEVLAGDLADSVAIDNNCTFDCNLAATYIDVNVNTCPECVEKVVRMWTVVETSCMHPERIVHIDIQHIEVYDTIDPVVAQPVNMTITTNTVGNFGPVMAGNLECGARFTFPEPIMSDECSDHLTWTISVLNDLAFPVMFADTIETKTPVSRDLPLGVNTVTYMVYDKCGNSSSVTWTVTVEDDTPPVAVCQVATTISLTYDGEAELYANSLNSGSYDDCAIDETRFELRRMDGKIDCDGNTDNNFYEYITFCCDDNTFQTDLHEVILRVWDKAGNSNECMVFVGVQDKFPPSITCPANEVKECDFAYDPNRLTDYFGWPTAYDNCGYTIEQVDSSTVEFECFAANPLPIKTITRNFTVTDEGGRTAECTQTINFVRTNYFGFVNGLTNEDGYGDIVWPGNETYTTCLDPNTANDPNSPLHPNQTGRPILNEFGCDEVGASYTDFLSIDNDNNLNSSEACFKIIRTWTVLDDCHKIGGSFVRWNYDQVIFVKNYVDPIIDVIPDETVCTFDSTCVDGFIELKYGFSDDCTQPEDLRWRYMLDLDNDGVDIDTSIIFGGDTLLASGDYPIGTHKIVWQVWDQCGNSAISEQFFTIQNCKKPTPICYKKLATDLTDPTNPAALVTDTMFNRASYHTCGYDLVYSFSADTTDHTKWYTCNEQGLDTLELWVTAILPDGTTTQDFCVVTIDVQDNYFLCGVPPAQGIVAGTIATEDNELVENVKIKLLGSEFPSQYTNIDGEFMFSPVSTDRSYTLEPVSNDDYMNGLSTLDLVYMQKHILNIKNIDSPYSLIASDVNNDNNISASDILSLRRLILGANDKLENNDAWLYINSDYSFENPNNPMAEEFANSLKIENLTGNINVDFIAVKIGDVSGDATVNSNDETESRSDESIFFTVENIEFVESELVEIPVKAKDFVSVQGFQTTFVFDQNSLEFEGLESGVLNVSEQNIATNRLANGYLPMSWFNNNALDVDDDIVLFVIKFKAIKSNNAISTLSINSDITKTEAYNGSLEKLGLELEYRFDNTGFELLQNRPNPFSHSTEIKFNLPNESQFSLDIYDFNGRLVYNTTGNAQKGMNSLQIEKSNLDVSGVLYYTLSTKNYTATRKMVVIK